MDYYIWYGQGDSEEVDHGLRKGFGSIMSFFTQTSPYVYNSDVKAGAFHIAKIFTTNELMMSDQSPVANTGNIDVLSDCE